MLLILAHCLDAPIAALVLATLWEHARPVLHRYVFWARLALRLLWSFRSTPRLWGLAGAMVLILAPWRADRVRIAEIVAGACETLAGASDGA